MLIPVFKNFIKIELHFCFFFFMICGVIIQHNRHFPVLFISSHGCAVSIEVQDFDLL